MTSTIYSKYQSVFILITGLFIIIGCKKGDDADSQLVASAGEDINVQIGLEVFLDGKGSSDLTGNPFEYSWKFISKPVSSNAILGNSNTESPSFIADIQGKYKIELTISNATEDRDTVLVSAFKVGMIDGNYENIVPGTDVGVRDFVVAGGHLFATCEFSEIGGIAAEKIAGYNGAAWSALGCGLEEGSIYEMIEYRGELYVTGNFDQIGCIPANNIARWSIETNSWREVEAGLTGGTNPFGYTLVIFNDELYVGGQFEKAGDVNAINIAKWNGSEWFPVGNMEGGSVRELVVFKQRLYAGGFFNAVNGLNTGHIASYDGNNWLAPGSLNELELKTTGVVRHMAVYKEMLYISGNFEVDNVEFSELITWDGNQFSDFGSAFSLFENTISELTVIGNNLYIGGNFIKVVGSEANNILQWDGESWGVMRDGISGTVLSIELYNEKIYIGGDFNAAGGTDAENISVWTEL